MDKIAMSENGYMNLSSPVIDNLYPYDMAYAYMNLTDYRVEYPILECHGILEALWAMTPEWSK